MSLFNLGNEYAALMEQLEVVYSWEPEYVVGKPLRVHLYHDDYNDKWYEKVDIHKATAYPTVKHKAKSKKPTATPARKPAPAAPTAVSEADDDYPF